MDLPPLPLLSQLSTALNASRLPHRCATERARPFVVPVRAWGGPITSTRPCCPPPSGRVGAGAAGGAGNGRASAAAGPASIGSPWVSAHNAWRRALLSGGRSAAESHTIQDLEAKLKFQSCKGPIARSRSRSRGSSSPRSSSWLLSSRPVPCTVCSRTRLIYQRSSVIVGSACT